MAAQPEKVKEIAKLAGVAKALLAPLEENQICELICQRAYELYEQRGCTHGNDVKDWLQAEAEVRANLTAKQVGKQS